MTEIQGSAKVRQTRWFQTREALLDAAVTSLVRHGHSGTTMARIQEYAGVSRGSLTHHFGSMQELLVAAISHVAEGQLAQVTDFAETLAPGHDPDELVGLLHRFMSGPMSSRVSKWRASEASPPVNSKAMIAPVASVFAWIFVVKPPRERPSA